MSKPLKIVPPTTEFQPLFNVFVECETCARKSDRRFVPLSAYLAGSQLRSLCSGCLNNRIVINNLNRDLQEARMRWYHRLWRALWNTRVSG